MADKIQEYNVEVQIPYPVVRGTGTSTYTEEQIHRRIGALLARTDKTPQQLDEIAFLRELLVKEFS